MNTEKRFKKLIIISSPSGAGKTTICKYLLKKIKNVELSISYTTRHKRINEIHGKDYYFINKEKFFALIKKNFFIEFARVFRNHYGSPHSNINKAFKNNNHILFDIDWQGTQQLAEMARDDLVTVFILPPSHEELEKRLRNRALDTRETEEQIQGRMSKASSEMSHYSEYDYVIINKDIESSISKAQTILDAERMRRLRLTGTSEFVRGLMGGL